MPDSDRVSIWSIARYWGVVYYILFSVQIAGIIGLVGWREIFRNTDDTAVDTLIAISLGVSPHVVTVAAETLVIVLILEGITMLAERYLKRRFEEGKSEGIELGKEAGIELGKEAGIELGREAGIELGKEAGIELGKEAERARNRKYASRLRAWNEARIKAADEGIPFDEPMPELDDEDDAA